mgnify:CR=1 FL=1
MAVQPSLTPVIHVAVGVVRRNGRVLIARRPDHVHQGGLLEFPGGKVEPGESVQEALVRELQEETGLTLFASELRPVIGIRYDYPDKSVFLDVWETDSSLDEPEGREGQSVQWCRLSELADEAFPNANRPIIRALRLPKRYAITGPSSGPEDFLKRLRRSLPGSGQSLCLLRVPELETSRYLRLVSEIVSPADWNQGVQWMLHGAVSTLEALPAVAGLHMPWRQARLYSARPIDERYWLAVSCHSASEVDHALQIGADFITLGPVKPTRSHPNATPMGRDGFCSLVAGAPIVVYGLGGLDKDAEAEIRACGAQGIAGISYWWT